MTTREWFSDGLFTLFFLIVGLEIRREMTAGALRNLRAALLPIVAAMGGVVAPALIYLAINRGAAARGWPIHFLAGTVLGLVAGKPIGIVIASGVAVKTRLASPIDGVTLRQFVGAACLCGVGDSTARK